MQSAWIHSTALRTCSRDWLQRQWSQCNILQQSCIMCATITVGLIDPSQCHCVTLSLCHSVTMSQCHGAVMWCGQYQSLHYLRENLLVTTIFHVSFMILKHAKASRKRETFIWTKILSVTMVGVVYKIQMVVSSTYSEVELLNFHIQSL